MKTQLQSKHPWKSSCEPWGFANPRLRTQGLEAFVKFGYFWPQAFIEFGYFWLFLCIIWLQSLFKSGNTDSLIQLKSWKGKICPSCLPVRRLGLYSRSVFFKRGSA